MWIIGCDYHPRFQQIAFVNTEGGEYGQKRLEHVAEAEQFYRSLAGSQVRIGMEASGHARWFERLLGELGFELWIGNPAAIRAAAPRKQKTDVRDAEHLLQLLLEGQFQRMRVGVPTAEQRDVRQLVLHRHRLVQMRTRVKNQLKAVVLNEGMKSRPSPWTGRGREQFEQLPLPAWTARRRQDNLELLDELVQRTDPLDQAVREQAQQPSRGGSADDASRGGAGYGADVRAHPGGSDALRQRQKGGQLSRSDSSRRQLGRTTTTGAPDQAGKCPAARVPGRSRPHRRGARAAVGTMLSPTDDEEESIHRGGGRGPQAGHTVVVDVASRTRVWAGLRVRFACRETRFSRWGVVHPRRSEWDPASLLAEGV